MNTLLAGAMVRRVIATAICLVAAILVVAASQGRGVAAPTLEDQVHSIARDLMCPVCAGQTVAESNSQLAEQMRQIIRERLQAGQSRDEIIAYFVAQFGEGVLAAPPPRGSGLALWLSLPAALIVGVFILRRFLRGQRTAPRPTPPAPSPDEVEQIEQALRKLD